MKRAGALAALTTLALLSVWSGRLELALALAAVKALVVGVVLMELEHAHRAHLAAFAAWTIFVAAGSWALAH